jgi:transposase
LATYYYRTDRGGLVPLNAKARRDLLELYADHERPVREIAELFGVGTNTIYRWLALLGVRPLSDMTAEDRERLLNKPKSKRRVRVAS